MQGKLYHAREVGICASGSRYVILQDGQSSYHITIQNGDNILYEHLGQQSSREDLMNNINILEKTLYN
jgi:hypothetical protein